MFTEQEILELKAIEGLAIVVRNAGALEWVARVIERINCNANYLPTFLSRKSEVTTS